MARDTTRPQHRLPVLCALILCPVLLLLVTSTAHAQGQDGDFWPDGNKPPSDTQVEYRVETRPDGVYVIITFRRSVPGSDEPGSQPAGQTPGEQPPASGGGSSPPASQAREWTDHTGYHRITDDGQRIDAMPPNISSATRDSWLAQMAAHPNERPYLLYINGQFQGVIWVPDTTDEVNLVVDEPPADSPPLPGGNANSTDPLEVALDALGHVPYPSVQLRANPGLGLVAMPSWFWVEGYDGRPLGVARTVTIPPEIGPEVPVAVVPADDPRRLPTSFTVEVRVSPSKYEWSFGDGTSLVADSLGKSFPAESDIQHTYEHSSLVHPSGFPLRLTVEFTSEFRVNGGAWVSLPAVQRVYEAGYRVQEVQPVLTQQ
ncbi:MAG: hypothetical protein ACYC4L_01355 [Chloroflexota bacterium]